MKKTLCILFALTILISLPSCLQLKKTAPDGYTFTDDLGRQVTISKEDKIAACHASFADCWLLAGGELVGVTSDAIEDHSLDVGDAKIIGSAKSVNKESLVASGADVALLSADLVAHLELRDALEDIGIRCIYFRVNTFSDYSRVMKHMTAVTGRDDLYQTNVTDVGDRIEAIREKIPQKESRTLLLIRAYSS